MHLMAARDVAPGLLNREGERDEGSRSPPTRRSAMDKKTEKTEQPKITNLRKQTLKVMKVETNLKAGFRCAGACGSNTLSRVGTC